MKKITLFFALVLTTLNFAFGQDTNKKKVYDETANAKIQISDAVTKAKKDNKHVLLQIGGNWCPWCILFDNLVT